ATSFEAAAHLDVGEAHTVRSVVVPLIGRTGAGHVEFAPAVVLHLVELDDIVVTADRHPVSGVRFTLVRGDRVRVAGDVEALTAVQGGLDALDRVLTAFDQHPVRGVLRHGRAAHGVEVPGRSDLDAVLVPGEGS